jgi:Mg-chelatase subunit ChlD
MMLITPLLPQNPGYFDKTTVIYEIQQVRYIEQKENPELKAGEDTVVSITLQQADLDLDQVPDEVLQEAQAAVDLPPRNICLVIDISGSMGGVISKDRIRLDLVKELCLHLMYEVIKDKDVVSVLAFYHENEVIIKHKYIGDAYDRQAVIEAIAGLKPKEKGNTFMRQALAAAYTVINELRDTGPYHNSVLLLTDGEQIEGRDPTETKAQVNEIVRKNKAEGIGTDVSTVAFFDSHARAHMEQVAELGGGTSLFIESEKRVPSRARLASLMNKELPNLINRAWRNAEFDVTLTLSDGVSCQEAAPYNKQQPQIQGNTLIYPHIRLGRSISLKLSLSEDAVHTKATILVLSVSSRDKRFSLLENYPLSLNNPVTADSDTGFVTFAIKKYKRGT